MVGLESFGLELMDVVPIVAPVNEDNRKYLTAKLERMGHRLDPDM